MPILQQMHDCPVTWGNLQWIKCLHPFYNNLQKIHNTQHTLKKRTLKMLLKYNKIIEEIELMKHFLIIR